MTKYTLSAESVVLAQVRGNKHWRTSQVRLKILNYRTCKLHLHVIPQQLAMIVVTIVLVYVCMTYRAIYVI
jgi:hypothetical protein